MSVAIERSSSVESCVGRGADYDPDGGGVGLGEERYQIPGGVDLTYADPVEEEGRPRVGGKGGASSRTGLSNPCATSRS